MPLRGSTSLVLGAGVYAAPAQLPLSGGLQVATRQALQGTSPSTSAALRADYVWKTPSGRTLGVGVQSSGTTRQTIVFSTGF
jgi:hypothetical protein